MVLPADDWQQNEDVALRQSQRLEHGEQPGTEERYRSDRTRITTTTTTTTTTFIALRDPFPGLNKKAQLTQGLRATAPSFQDGRQPPSWILPNRK